MNSPKTTLSKSKRDNHQMETVILYRDENYIGLRRIILNEKNPSRKEGQ
jgi:hypothetical protein